MCDRSTVCDRSFGWKGACGKGMSATRIDLEARELEEIGYTYQECREFEVWLSDSTLSLSGGYRLPPPPSAHSTLMPLL